MKITALTAFLHRALYMRLRVLASEQESKQRAVPSGGWRMRQKGSMPSPPSSPPAVTPAPPASPHPPPPHPVLPDWARFPAQSGTAARVARLGGKSGPIWQHCPHPLLIQPNIGVWHVCRGTMVAAVDLGVEVIITS